MENITVENHLEIHNKRLQAVYRKERLKILKLASSFEHPHILNIGIMDNYGISIVEQQYKAFLLAQTLIESKKITRNSKIAVVGAGAAGLSFSVAAALKKKCHVTVFEQEDTVLPLLTRVHWRWVVPFYDFLQSSFFSEETNLPFLNWKADYAWKVARDLKRKWEVYKKHYNLTDVCGVRVDFPIQECTKKPKLIANGKATSFDFIIVATGFGQVKQLKNVNSYWTSGSPNDYIAKKKNEKVLISGSGDAGLVELFHFCIKDFYHDDILNFYDWKARGHTLRQVIEGMAHYRDQLRYFREELENEDEDKIYRFDFLLIHLSKDEKLKTERMSRQEKITYVERYYKKAIQDNVNAFNNMFKTIRFEESYLDYLSKHLSTKFKVILNGVSLDLFDIEKDVNPHNMILASALYRLGAFKYIHGRLEKEKIIKGRTEIKVQINKKALAVDRLVLRHGQADNAVFPLTFSKEIEIDDEDKKCSWGYFINRDYKEFYHTQEVKEFLVFNYLDEVDRITSSQIWEGRKLKQK